MHPNRPRFALALFALLLPVAALGTACDPKDEDADNPCAASRDGVLDEDCVAWAIATCEDVPVDDCDGHMLEATSAGEVGCARAGALTTNSACVPGQPERCVAAFHTGDHGFTSYFSGEEAYAVPCDQAVPCPAQILGMSSCGAEGTPPACGCQ